MGVDKYVVISLWLISRFNKRWVNDNIPPHVARGKRARDVVPLVSSFRTFADTQLLPHIQDLDYGFIEPSKRDMFVNNTITLPLFEDVVLEAIPVRALPSTAACTSPSPIHVGTASFTVVADVVDVYSLHHDDDRVDCTSTPEICVKTQLMLGFSSTVHIAVVDDAMSIIARVHLTSGTKIIELVGRGYDGGFSMMEVGEMPMEADPIPVTDTQQQQEQQQEQPQEHVGDRSKRAATYRMDATVFYTELTRTTYGDSPARAYCDQAVSLVRFN